MTNSSEPNSNIVNPDPRILFESLRNMGYSLEAAIEDIIDNSITAGAKNIWLNTDYSGTYLMISDDGCGMTDEELKLALRFGSKDSLTPRSRSDLGRFGLGLKLASFSYCRILTVASKTWESPVSIRQWSLDHVHSTNQWEQLIPDINDQRYKLIKEKLDSLKHGTVVYWEDIDRFGTKGNNGATGSGKNDWAAQFGNAREHMRMVFHRYLDEEEGDCINIWFPGGDKARPWDPFMRDQDAVIENKVEHIPGIALYAYVIPHPEKLINIDEREEAGPLKTLDNAQGFYVYRGKRLITAGSWLHLQGFSKSRATNLARIRLDILSNNEDSEWMLDVKKSTVRIPKRYREEIKRIATNTATLARRVKITRGNLDDRQYPDNNNYLWTSEETKDGKSRFKINRNHPLIAQYLKSEISLTPEKFSNLLLLIEQSVPAQGIVLQGIQDKEYIPELFDGLSEDEICELMKRTLNELKLDDNMSAEKKRSYVMSVEPFSDERYQKTALKVLNEGGL